MANNQWENAVNREFIETLIKKIDVMKTEFETTEITQNEIKQYYQNVGLLLCHELYEWFEKDFEM